MPGHRTLWRLAALVLAWAGATSCKPEHAPTAVAPPAVAIIVPPWALAGAEAPIERLQADTGQIAAGRQIAVSNCSSCHALDADSTSPKPEAPRLKSALWRYDEDALATHLIDAIRVGHGNMPLFDFNVIGADALIAYLRSIRSPREE